MKKRVIFFKKSRMRLIAMGQPLEFNFKKRDIKKLVNDYVKSASKLHVKEDESYFIELEIESTTTILRLLIDAMIRRTKAIRRVMGWND